MHVERLRIDAVASTRMSPTSTQVSDTSRWPITSPDITIIAPCRNEIRFIDAFLESVIHQELDGLSFEILVIDGHSDDGTRQKLDEWERRDGRITVLDNPERRVPTSLNIGIRNAAGQYVVRLDVHSTYPADYVQRCISGLRSGLAENVGGAFLTQARGNTLGAKLVQALTTHPFGVGAALFRLSATAGYVDTVPYGCYRRSLFDQIGLFDERLSRNQDYEFNQRLRFAGGRIWLDPKIQIRYFNQPSLRSLCRQAFGNGQWNVWTWWLAPYSFRLRHALPGLFTAYFALSTAAIAIVPSLASFLAFLPLVIYLLAALVSGVQQALRYRVAVLAILLPPAFLSYHLAYGIGILYGAIRLAARRTPIASGALPWASAPWFRIPTRQLRLDPTSEHRYEP